MLSWWLNWYRICLQCRRPGLYSWLGKIPGEGNGNPRHILAWRMQWTEETGGLQSMGSPSDMTELLTHTMFMIQRCNIVISIIPEIITIINKF